MSNGWMKKGDEALTEPTSDRRRAPRFWMLPEAEAVVVFVDSSPVRVYEHRFKRMGRMEYATCTAETGSCKLCDALRKEPGKVLYLTCIDTREFTTKKGKKVKNSISLYGFKGKTAIAKLQDLLKSNGNNLKGLAFKVKRYDSMGSSSGEIVEKYRDKRYDITKLNPEAAPFNYEEVLKPLTDMELRRMGIHTEYVGEVDDFGVGTAETTSEEAPWDEEEETPAKGAKKGSKTHGLDDVL